MIREGDTVIVRMHDDESSHMLCVKDHQKLFKKKVCVEALIGAPYGSVFELTGNSLTRVKDNSSIELEDTQTVTSDYAETGTLIKGDNSNYNDTNTAQKMTNSKRNGLLYTTQCQRQHKTPHHLT